MLMLTTTATSSTVKMWTAQTAASWNESMDREPPPAGWMIMAVVTAMIADSSAACCSVVTGQYLPTTHSVISHHWSTSTAVINTALFRSRGILFANVSAQFSHQCQENTYKYAYSSTNLHFIYRPVAKRGWERSDDPPPPALKGQLVLRLFECLNIVRLSNKINKIESYHVDSSFTTRWRHQSL